jgi:hypothetical protein
MTYTVFDEGQTRIGTARDILEGIRHRAAVHNEEIARLDVDQYADGLIEDAPYVLPEGLVDAITAQTYPTKFDKALTLLASMPTSGIRILTMQAA